MDVKQYIPKYKEDIILCIKSLSTKVICRIFPEIKELFKSNIYNQLDKCMSKFTKKELNQCVVQYFKSILEHKLTYKYLLSDKYLQYFHNYVLEHKDKEEYCTWYDNFYVQNPSYGAQYTILLSSSVSMKLQLQHTKTNKKYIAEYDQTRVKWKLLDYPNYLDNSAVYLDDYHIFSKFLTEYIRIGSTIQVTNKSLLSYYSYREVNMEYKNLLAETGTILDFNPNTNVLICEFQYDGHFLNCTKETMNDLNIKDINKIYLYFSLVDCMTSMSKFTLMLVELSFINYIKPREISQPLFTYLRDSVFIDNTQFMQHYIDKDNFNDCIVKYKRKNLFALDSFYGTELFNIMSTYI